MAKADKDGSRKGDAEKSRPRSVGGRHYREQEALSSYHRKRGAQTQFILGKSRDRRGGLLTGTTRYRRDVGVRSRYANPTEERGLVSGQRLRKMEVRKKPHVSREKEKKMSARTAKKSRDKGTARPAETPEIRSSVLNKRGKSLIRAITTESDDPQKATGKTPAAIPP